MDFAGSKVALLLQERLVVYKRDDKPDIPHPAKWDLPGGGREGDETPVECVCREVLEEFGLTIDPNSILWQQAYPSNTKPDLNYFFLVACLTERQVSEVVFGSEGERWELMPIGQFIEHPEGVVGLQETLRDYQLSRGV